MQTDRGKKCRAKEHSCLFVHTWPAQGELKWLIKYEILGYQLSEGSHLVPNEHDEAMCSEDGSEEGYGGLVTLPGNFCDMHMEQKDELNNLAGWLH